jgi:hypothetical protein
MSLLRSGRGSARWTGRRRQYEAIGLRCKPSRPRRPRRPICVKPTASDQSLGVCEPGDQSSCHRHRWRPCCDRRFHYGRRVEEPETSHSKTVDLGHAHRRGRCRRPAARTREHDFLKVDLPAWEGDSHRAARAADRADGRWRRWRAGGMPIVTESEVAKSGRQAHDNDACGFAHGTIAHRRVPPVSRPRPTPRRRAAG